MELLGSPWFVMNSAVGSRDIFIFHPESRWDGARLVFHEAGFSVMLPVNLMLRLSDNRACSILWVENAGRWYWEGRSSYFFRPFVNKLELPRRDALASAQCGVRCARAVGVGVSELIIE